MNIMLELALSAVIWWVGLVLLRGDWISDLSVRRMERAPDVMATKRGAL